jgi:hypothetical protein
MKGPQPVGDGKIRYPKVAMKQSSGRKLTILYMSLLTLYPAQAIKPQLNMQREEWANTRF